MVMNTTTGREILDPVDSRDLVLPYVRNTSIATQVATFLISPSSGFRVPVVAADPVANWVNEGEEIAPSDMQLREVSATLHKLAGLTIVTNELRQDSSPEATQAVGDGLSRDIARKLDAAFFGALPDPAPQGLASLKNVTTIKGGLTSTDPFIEAISVAEVAESTITAFVANPADVLALGKVKKAAGSNEALLQPDPARPVGRMIAGVPIMSSVAVPAGTIWGIPKDYCYLVIHENMVVEIDESVFFTSDRVAIRAKLRAGFAFPHEPGIVKITTGSGA